MKKDTLTRFIVPVRKTQNAEISVCRLNSTIFCIKMDVLSPMQKCDKGVRQLYVYLHDLFENFHLCMFLLLFLNKTNCFLVVLVQ